VSLRQRNLIRRTAARRGIDRIAFDPPRGMQREWALRNVEGTLSPQNWIIFWLEFSAPGRQALAGPSMFRFLFRFAGLVVIALSFLFVVYDGTKSIADQTIYISRVGPT